MTSDASCNLLLQHRGCLASNVMGISWGTFKLKGLGGVSPSPCAIPWEWVGSSWPGGCWARSDLGQAVSFQTQGPLPSVSACHLCKAKLRLLLYLAHINHIHPTPPTLGPACAWDLPAALSKTCANWLLTSQAVLFTDSGLQAPKNEKISLGINRRVLMNLYLYVLSHFTIAYVY